MASKKIHLFYIFFLIISFSKYSLQQTGPIYLEGEYDEEITLTKENNTEYTFIIKNNDYIYLFETDEEGYIFKESNILCPRLYASQFINSTITLNHNKDIKDKEIKIKISSVKDNNTIINSEYKNKDEIYYDIYIPEEEKKILIYDFKDDYFFYSESFDEQFIVKIAEYSPNMTLINILDGDEEYFEESNNMITQFEEGKIYIIILESYSVNKANKILIQPKNLEKNIDIDNNTNFLCIPNTGEFTLNLIDNTYNVYIKLSKLSLDSDISIKDLTTEELFKLNKNNKYYNFKSEKISININEGEFSLIEFVFKRDLDMDILDEQYYYNYEINKPYNLIKFNNNNKGKKILLRISSENGIPFNLMVYSGTSKDNYIYNTPNLDIENTSEEDFYNILIKNDENLEQDEYKYIFIQFDESQIKNKSYAITLNKVEEFSWEKINAPMPKEKAELAKETMRTIFKDIYVYTEIKKNPPNPDYWGKADLLEDLDKVSTDNRNYYDFYRDIKKITGKNKDNHFLIDAYRTPEGIEIDKIVMCLPFRFVIKQNPEPKIYIEKFECFKYFDDETKKFVESHLNIPLTHVNNKTIFQYVQDFGNEYFAHHSKHATFSINMLFSYQVPISHIPLNKEELSGLTFIFEDGTNITLDYYLYDLNFDEELANDPDFEEFFEIETNKNLNIFLILEAVSKYKKMKNNEENENSNLIQWDYSTEDEGIKCYIDKKNKVNVIVQKTFDYENHEELIDFYNNCTEKFYNNSYPIIVIESLNNGGYAYAAHYAMQFLQVKLLPKIFTSVKYNDFIINYMKNLSQYDSDFADIVVSETCEPFNWDNAKEITDDYGINVIHKRTETFGLFSSNVLKEYKKRREKYYEFNHLKKPTELLIFTDGYSFSATSFFIKGLQEIGGAITVGYYGNPEDPDAKFDASQSTSGEVYYDETELNENLEEVGFINYGITSLESFNYSYQGDNPIPREYLIYPVDERVDIFEKYDDTKYQKFIDKAKEIFKKYNQDKKCNPDNKILLFEPDDNKCYKIEGDEKAHGGYPCKSDGTWDENNCVPFYCDIGYYYDTYQKKCLKDLCTEEKGDDERTDDTTDDRKTDTSTDDGNTDKEKPEDDGLEAWIIAIIVVGAIVVIAIIILLIFIFRRKKSGSEKSEEDTPILMQDKSDD